VDVNVEKETLLDNFKLGGLPVLSAKFIELLELLVSSFHSPYKWISQISRIYRN